MFGGWKIEISTPDFEWNTAFVRPLPSCVLMLRLSLGVGNVTAMGEGSTRCNNKLTLKYQVPNVVYLRNCTTYDTEFSATQSTYATHIHIHIAGVTFPPPISVNLSQIHLIAKPQSDVDKEYCYNVFLNGAVVELMFVELLGEAALVSPSV